MIIPFARWRLVASLAVAAAIGGTVVAVYYFRLGLTLTHYDARGHLIVARRIFDSITPGWQQIGAVWLPLPHLLNAIPVQVDAFYRTGASAVAISIVAFAIATAAIGWIVMSVTDSAPAAIAGAAVFALNPNVLYLQSTPMTEPLLLALTTCAIATLMAWSGDFELRASAFRLQTSDFRLSESTVGWLFALACLTRYEAWPVTASALAAAAWVRWRQGASVTEAAKAVARVALYPAVAIVAFAAFSRLVIGEWFLSGGFFVAENKALGDATMAVKEIGWGAREVSGQLLVAIGLAGAIALVVVGLLSRRRAAALVPVSLVTMAAIPFAAFVDGHPFRIRYVVPLMAIEGIGAGVLAGLAPRRARVAAAVVVAAIVAFELRPIDAKAPMVIEAQWDRPNEPIRAAVTECLGRPGSGETIMASMGSLGHYMQEASNAGFAVRDFLHEGNGDIWLAALGSPRPFVEWVMIEEKAEGGDMLARIARERPSFLRGYVRVCDGAGLALYRRLHQKSAG